MKRKTVSHGPAKEQEKMRRKKQKIKEVTLLTPLYLRDTDSVYLRLHQAERMDSLSSGAQVLGISKMW